MNKKAKKALIITGTVLGSIVAVFLLLYLILAIIGWAAYGEARELREYVCVIPETNSGFAPQGITYGADGDVYILTGYDSDDTTLLYIVKGESYRKVKLVDKDGNTVKGHAGGVTCTKNNVYVANGSLLLMFELDKLLAAGDSPVEVSRIFPVDNTAAYCYSDDKYLYVGEFYRSGNYETDPSHHFTTPNGENNKAIVSCYELDENGLLAPEGVQPYPMYCVSITGLVQGFAAKNGTFVMSRSYGLKNSSLDYHSAPKDSGSTITVKFAHNADAPTKAVPLYFLDNSTMFRSLTLPAFSEDVTIVNDKVIVTNEASANKYIVGKFFGAHKVYAYPLFTA